MAATPHVAVSHDQRGVADLLLGRQLLQGRRQLPGDCSLHLDLPLHRSLHGGEFGFRYLPPELCRLAGLEVERGRCGHIVGVGQLIVVLAEVSFLRLVRGHVHRGNLF